MLVHSVDHRHEIMDSVAPQQTAAHRIGYHVKKGSVSIVRSEYLTGLNKHSQKRWFRWQTSSVRNIRKTKHGKIVGLKRDLKHYLSVMPWTEYREDPMFRSLVEDQFGTLSWDSMYPMAQKFSITSEFDAVPGMLPFLRATTSSDLTVALFGTKRYSNELAKAVDESDLDTLRIARDFRGLVHDDDLSAFIRKSTAPRAARFRSIRDKLLMLDEFSLGKLISEPINGRNYYAISHLSSPRREAKPIFPGPTSWSDFDQAL